jgi:CBS domain-containing protein
MSRDLVVMPGWLPVSALADRASTPRHGAYPVVDATGAPLGIIDLGHIRCDLMSDDRTLAEICTPLSRVQRVSPDDTVAGPIPRQRTGRGAPTLVIENARLIGVVTPGSLLRFARGHAMIASDAPSVGAW